MLRALSGDSPLALPAAKAVGRDEFSALIKPFGPFPHPYHFAIAVSGGPDSMALALCAKEWAEKNDQRLIAFIVDHGLRSESANEAQETHERLKGIGINSEILIWEHAPIVTKLHMSARKARYRLLIDACKRRGIPDLWLAHQREDQAETILMRIAKGTGIDGLAGIAAENKVDDIRLLRPFLSVAKERLIATCQNAELRFAEDASNASEKFARGRLRRVMPLLADEGFTLDRLIDLGMRAASVKDALDFYTHTLLQEATSRDDAGAIRIDLARLSAAPCAIAGRVLSACLNEVRAEDYAPEYASLMKLIDALCADGEMPSRTLQGCMISKTPTHVTVQREIAHITDAPIIKPGESVLWDKRWHVNLTKNAAGDFTIRPLGTIEHDVLDRLAPNLRHDVPQGRARAALPALYQDGKLKLIPSFQDDSPARAQLVSVWPPG